MNNQNNNFRRILIYSKKCPTCSSLMVMMQNLNILLNFDIICIDDLIMQKKPLPQGVSVVPALIIPEMNSILQGKECFVWIERMRVNTIKLNIMKNMQGSGPNGFADVEMSGFSDNFAYTNTDLAQPKSFLPYGKDDEYAIYTGAEVSKLKQNDVKKMIQEAENKRKEQEKHLAMTQEESRNRAIMDYEKQKIFMNN